MWSEDDFNEEGDPEEIEIEFNIDVIFEEDFE
jgi:hypothetical protein